MGHIVLLLRSTSGKSVMCEICFLFYQVILLVYILAVIDMFLIVFSVSNAPAIKCLANYKYKIFKILIVGYLLRFVSSNKVNRWLALSCLNF